MAHHPGATGHRQGRQSVAEPFAGGAGSHGLEMSTFATIALAGIGLFFALIVGLNLFIRVKSKALKGKPLPNLPGKVGKAINRAPDGVVYFFSPSCAACRTLTPIVQKAAQKDKYVFAVDVTKNLELARALSVMATPSTLQVSGGRVVDVHVGTLPRAVMQRLSPS